MRHSHSFGSLVIRHGAAIVTDGQHAVVVQIDVHPDGADAAVAKDELRDPRVVAAELAGMDPNSLPPELRDMMNSGGISARPSLPGLGGAKLPGLGALPGLGGNPFKGFPGLGKKK